MPNIIGKVTYFNSKKGYGFIEGNDDNDYFVHFSDINEEGFNTLNKDSFVEFDVKETDGENDKAINVTKLDRNPNIEHDTEDKDYWVKKGADEEPVFIEKIAPLINKRLKKNPEKEKDETKIDLIDFTDGNVVYADLKTQRTPFFSAKFKCGIDPKFAVTFNKNDYEKYKKDYPHCLIYWWVNWEQLKWKKKCIKALHGVWLSDFSKMTKKIENGYVYLHEYKRRKNDNKNAKESYIFDLRNFVQLYRWE